jgi:HK97 family phage prohead protease
MERRCFTLTDAEVRDSAGGRTFRGYAAVFNEPAELFGFHERVVPTAFDQSLEARDDIRFLFNHNADHVLGRTKSGTLRLSKDGRGLLSEAELPNTTVGNDVAEMMNRGDLDGMSFGFRTRQDNFRDEDIVGEDGQIRRVTMRDLLNAQLLDVSVVTFPAYAGASGAELRALQYLGAGLPGVMLQSSAIDYTTLRTSEERAGKVLSAANAEALSKVLAALDGLNEPVGALRALLQAASGEDEQKSEAEPEVSEPPYDLDLRRKRLRLAELAR